jgi:hypothetical protein
MDNTGARILVPLYRARLKDIVKEIVKISLGFRLANLVSKLSLVQV